MSGKIDSTNLASTKTNLFTKKKDGYTRRIKTFFLRKPSRGPTGTRRNVASRRGYLVATYTPEIVLLAQICSQCKDSGENIKAIIPESNFCKNNRRGNI